MHPHPQTDVEPAPHPSHVRPDGIQDEENEQKEEKSHVRSMTEECTSKAAKPKAAPKTRVSKKPGPVADGSLSKKSVVKLDSTANRMKAALSIMEEQLESAAKSMYIAPQLISKLSMVKTSLYAEASSLTLYKENNREDDTHTFIVHAKEKLESAVQEFSVLRKLLKAEVVAIRPDANVMVIRPDANVPGSVPDVD